VKHVTHGPFAVDTDRLVLFAQGEPLALSPKTVELFTVLLERRGEVVLKGELLSALWPDTSVEEANLSQHVYVLRKALRARDPGLDRSIVTVPKRGYRFVEPLATSRSGQPPAVRSDLPALVQVARAPVRRAHRTWSFATRFAIVALLVLAVSATFASRAVPNGSRLVPSAGAAEDVRMGWYFMDRRTLSGLRRSKAFFIRAIASDPAQPASYAGLADAYMLTADYSTGAAFKRSQMLRAAALARRALELDPNSADAHAALGNVAYLGHHDFKTAQLELERAIVLDPNNAAAHLWLGAAHFDRGDYAVADRELAVATQLDPGSTAASAWRQTSSYFIRNYDAAIDYGQRTAELNPAREDTLRDLGVAYAAKGEYAAAIATFRRISTSDKAFASVPLLLANVYARTGRREAARSIVTSARKRNVRDPELAFALLALGDRGGAVSSARRLRFDNCGQRLLFAHDPRFDAVRTDTRFRGVLDVSCQEAG